MNNQIGRTVSPTKINGALLALKIKRGFYMGGTISPDQRACKCGGRFIKKTFRGANYFSCDKCDKDPSFFRVRRYLPGPFGEKAESANIRYDSNGKRLTTIQAAHATMEYIDGLISSGKFDPSEFMIRKANNMLLFRNFVEKKYLPSVLRKLERGEIKTPTYTSKEGIIRLHLMPFFGEINIKNIKASTFTEFLDQGKFTNAYRRLILGELKVILNKAHELEMIDTQPCFPKMKKPKLKDPEKLLTFEQQMKVLEHMDDDRYRTMFNILCLIALRPSEVRAIKWSDWDFKNNKLWIKRHVSGKSIIPGRKSNDDVHSIALSKELLKCIQHMPRPIHQDAYLFKGDHGEIVSKACLSRAWRKAIKLAGLPHVDSYRGSKASCMSNWLRAGYSPNMIATFTGLTEEDVARYAQHSGESIHNMQLQMMEG